MALLSDERVKHLEETSRISGLVHGETRAVFDHIRQLTCDLEAARAERDLAIAHDRQPYPTAEAYEAVCAALNKHKHDLAEAKIEIERLANWGTLARENERLTKALRSISNHCKDANVPPYTVWDAVWTIADEALAAKA